jgi:uncharacterized protein (DUF1499 family)
VAQRRHVGCRQVRLTRSEIGRTVFVVLTVSIVGLLVAIQFGVLNGTRPDDLGVREGQLKPPSTTRNSVSSQAAMYPGHAQIDYAKIAPLPLKNGDPVSSMEALVSVLQAMPGMAVIERRADYLYAQAQTRWLKFVDDVEFVINTKDGTIEVRSASRLGREDFGANRTRVEAIRADYLAAIR